MTEGELKIGVYSRRAPIGPGSIAGARIEHVGGLSRVIPAIAEYAEVAWTTFATTDQIGVTEQYSFSNFADQALNHNIEIYFANVASGELEQSDWFFNQYIWLLLHDLPIPELSDVELGQYFNSIRSISRALTTECVDVNIDGYFVNDFQLSQVPKALRKNAPSKQITFFLHTPWPKFVPNSRAAKNVLEFLATGMLDADVIQFQTHKDLAAFEEFVTNHLPLVLKEVKLEVNPVSVQVQQLSLQSLGTEDLLNLGGDEISYVHIARSDPIKNTLASIHAFTHLAREFKESAPRSYLDLYIVPSRQQWPLYQTLLSDIVQTVEQCNSKLSSLGYLPIRLHIGNDYQRAIQALIRYDYLIVCSMSDGLNLVVKEGATLNNRNGVIISTKNVGAMTELGSFCIVAADATDIGISKALKEADALSCESRRQMSSEMKRQIHEFDASFWAQAVVANFKILENV